MKAACKRIFILALLHLSVLHVEAQIDCSKGTILFKEDFGGNDPADPVRPTANLLGNKTTYKFDNNPNDNVNDGEYALMKQLAPFPQFGWVNFDDHTYEKNLEKGYFMLVNASYTAGQFYETTISDLCINSKLYFSVWIGNLMLTGGIEPDLRFEIYETSNPSNRLAQYDTETVPPNNSNGWGKWVQHGFTFTTPSSSIILKLFNKAPGGSGNDLVLDDIEVRFCAPPILLSSPQSVYEIAGCDSVKLSGSYSEDPLETTFGNDLIGRWEYSTTGDINNTAGWSPVSGTEKNSSNGYIQLDNYVTQSGYYRFVAADITRINTYKCRAMSDVINVTVKKYCRIEVNPHIRIRN
ncbi:MAG: hypothetical protein LBH32_09445 [Dysgonamonadaceae bacterium]|jgi:hypothetical protein|nr:hypothetical protein [Dysgonamonadaceae bacterium]